MTISTTSATFQGAPISRPSAFPVQSLLLSGLLVLVPALVFLNRGIVWPLMYGDKLLDTSGLFGGLGVYETHPLHKIWFPALAAFTLALFAIARVRRPDYRLRSMAGWFALFAWSALSVSWAIEPGIALSRLILQLLVAGCLYLAFCGTNRPKDIITAIYWMIVVTVFLNFYAVLTQEPTPLGHRGIFQHKNHLGSFSVMAVMFLLWKLADGRRYWLVALALTPICLFMLVESESKTSFGLLFIALAFGASVAFFAWGLRIPALISFVLACISLALLSMGLSAVAGVSFWQQMDALTGDATLTGRTGIWSFVWPYVEARPWVGYGFRSFWQIGENSPQLTLGSGFIATAAHAHNGYVDMLLNGGLIGLALVVPILVASLNMCGRISARRLYEGFVLSSMVIFILLHNMLETTFLSGVNVMFVLFQIIWLYMAYTVDRDGNASAAG